MALRNQPYLPLYIQDFLTDEKLIECSAESTGVYIRLLCILHKSDEYGKILLKQKDKQHSEQIKNFAIKIAKQMPYTFDIIYNSLIELINEKVIDINEDYLIQKRMVKDNDISEKRAESGKKGGKNNIKNNKNFALAKIEAKYENVNEDVNNRFNFKKSMLDYGFKENLIDDWLKVRKTKKASNTQTAYLKFINQVELSKIDKNIILEKCVEKSWSGFDAEWIKKDEVKKPVNYLGGIV